MRELFNTPLFGITISLLTFEFGTYLYNKTKKAVFNPLFISQGLIILFLLKFNISVESFHALQCEKNCKLVKRCCKERLKEEE